MRLLFITQAVDELDPVLGFVVGWLRAFSEEFPRIKAVCLRKGVFTLPQQVSVYSLGKERGGNKLRYSIRFLRYIWKTRREYDAVLVHMNPEYILLGALLWKWYGKKVGLWYNHQAGGLRIRLAAFLADTIFYTSPFSFTARFGNAVRMPVGIDTEIFQFDGRNLRETHPVILSLGRLAPIKHIEVIIEAVRLLLDEGMKNMRLAIVGDALPRDKSYFEKIKSMQQHSGHTESIIIFAGEPERKKVAQCFSSSVAYVNASPAGLFDKTVFEAMSCECIPLVSSKAFLELLPSQLFFKENDATDLALRLREILALSVPDRKKLGGELRRIVAAEHSLSLLVRKLYTVYENLLHR